MSVADILYKYTPILRNGKSFSNLARRNISAFLLGDSVRPSSIRLLAAPDVGLRLRSGVVGPSQFFFPIVGESGVR